MKNNTKLTNTIEVGAKPTKKNSDNRFILALDGFRIYRDLFESDEEWLEEAREYNDNL